MLNTLWAHSPPNGINRKGLQPMGHTDLCYQPHAYLRRLPHSQTYGSKAVLWAVLKVLVLGTRDAHIMGSMHMHFHAETSTRMQATRWDVPPGLTRYGAVSKGTSVLCELATPP